MTRRRRWKAPNNPTAPARQVWAALFPGEPWPAGWRVQWAGFMRGALGLTIYRERRILLSWGDLASAKRIAHPDAYKGAVDVLLHEFIHVRAGSALRHGQEFRHLENGVRSRLGLGPWDVRPRDLVRRQTGGPDHAPTE